jgi:transposase-like protein
MQMLYPLRVSIQQYIKRVQEAEEAERCCPEACPQCEAKERMKPHGYYCRTIADEAFDGVIHILRYLCGVCRRTVSLLPEWALPYLRFSVPWIGTVVTARLDAGRPWKDAAPGAPYQRAQPWVRRFRNQAEGLSAALAALTAPEARPDFVSRALGMLEKTGWIEAHRFLFGAVRVHLLGWPSSLAPCGRRVSINAAEGGAAVFLQTSCGDPKKASG